MQIKLQFMAQVFLRTEQSSDIFRHLPCQFKVQNELNTANIYWQQLMKSIQASKRFFILNISNSKLSRLHCHFEF